MNQPFSSLLLGLAAVAAAPAALAWNGKSEAGFVMARGNAETETANAKLAVEWNPERWKHGFGAALLYGESNDVTTAERWDARWQSDFEFSERVFWFGALRHEDDRYSGFDYQSSISTGIGRAFIQNENTMLRGQLGAGYRRLRPETLVKDASGAVIERLRGETDAGAVVNGRLRFEHALNDATAVLNTLLVEAGSDNTLSQNELALEVKMNSVLAIALGLTVRYNSEPAAGQKRTDTLTTVNLVYSLNPPTAP